MNITKLKHDTSEGKGRQRLFVQIIISTMVLALSAGPVFAKHHVNEQPFGATSIIIETTDNDIELQVFVDGFLWKRLQVFAPNERRIFELETKKNIRRQGGLSELFFATEPTHYLEDDPSFDGTVEAFLARFPEGEYEFGP